MINATHLKAYCTAASLLEKGDVPRRIERTKGGLSSKLHAVCDEAGRPILLLSEGQMSGHKGARLVLEALPPGSTLIADRRYDSDWFRDALAEGEITSCIPPTKNRMIPIAYDKALYRQRHKVENIFAKPISRGSCFGRRELGTCGDRRRWCW